MKLLLNKSKFLWMLVLVFTSATMLSSCDKDELEIQHNYPFEVNVMPVPGDVAKGQTVEIRITIQRSGKFNDAEYYTLFPV